MKKGQLEYIKVVSLAIIAVSLSIIAWNSSKEVSYLQGIKENISDIIQHYMIFNDDKVLVIIELMSTFNQLTAF